MAELRDLKRYKCDIPVQIRIDGKPSTLIPDDISLNSCFISESELYDGKNIQDVIIKLSYEDQIIINNPLSLSPQKPRNTGLILKWALTEEQEQRLKEFLENSIVDSVPTAKKAEYMIEEQKYLTSQINLLDDNKHKRLKFIFTMIVAYLAYFVVPHTVLKGNITRDMALFYTLCGIWISMSLFMYTDRALKFIVSAYRRKVFYYKCILLNRAFIFDNDKYNSAYRIFPDGLEYNTAKIFAYPSKTDKYSVCLNQNRAKKIEEKYSDKHDKKSLGFFHEPIKYDHGMSLYITFLQLLFVGGLIYYGSLILRLLENPGVIVPLMSQFSDNKGHLNMYDYEYFLKSVWVFSLILFTWVQVTVNRCKIFQQNVWEARKISVRRPNPKVSGLRFREDWYYNISRILVWVIFAFGTVELVYYVFELRRGNASNINNINFAFFTVLLTILLFLGKVYHIHRLLKCESNAQKELKPLS